MARTTTQVIEDHLVKRLEGDVEGDIKANFSSDVVILSDKGLFEGEDGIRRSVENLASTVGDSHFIYTRTLIKGGYAFLEWEAESDGRIICKGADSFVVEGEKIVFQSIYYYMMEDVGEKQ